MITALQKFKTTEIIHYRVITALQKFKTTEIIHYRVITALQKFQKNYIFKLDFTFCCQGVHICESLHDVNLVV